MLLETLLPSLEISVAFNVGANELLPMKKKKTEKGKVQEEIFESAMRQNSTDYCAYFTSVYVIMGLLVHS